MTDSYSIVILGLKSAHDQMQWYEKLFFPYQLASELENYSKNRTAENELKIFKAFEKNTWFFQRWFFSSLQRFHDNWYTVSLRTLHEKGLLAGDTGQVNFNAVVASKSPWSVAPAIVTLNKSGLLTGDTAQAYFNAVITHPSPEPAASAFDALNKAGLLTDDNFKVVVNKWEENTNQWIKNVAPAIVLLDEADLLTGHAAQTNINTVAKHKLPVDVAAAFRTLNKADLLTSDNYNTVVTHCDTQSLSSALSDLSEAGLLTGDAAQANINAVFTHPDTHELVVALDILKNGHAGLLKGNVAQVCFNALVKQEQPSKVASTLAALNRITDLLTGTTAQANINAVAEHQEPHDVVEALVTLSKTNLLKGNIAQVCFNAVVTHQDLYSLHRTLEAIYKSRSRILTGNAAQANFNALVITNTAILLHHDAIGIWDEMPYKRPTAAEFQAIIAIAQRHADNPKDGSIALWAYVRTNILGEVIKNQSTPAASVHVPTTYNLALPTAPKKDSSVANNPNTLFHLDKNSDLKDTSSGMAFNPKN